jgi:hypothetical protein
MTIPLIPSQQPEKVWLLQQVLLCWAEQLMGPRSEDYRICRPTFAQGGSRLRFSVDLSAVWAELSPNAAGYWPTLVFELAHETIHLLNPIQGYTNVLEEGIATEFQSIVAPALSGVQIPIPLTSYLEAQADVWLLKVNAFEAGRLVRQRCEALGKATTAALCALFPMVGAEVAAKLASTCVPR